MALLIDETFIGKTLPNTIYRSNTALTIAEAKTFFSQFLPYRYLFLENLEETKAGPPHFYDSFMLMDVGSIADFIQYLDNNPSSTLFTYDVYNVGHTDVILNCSFNGTNSRRMGFNNFILNSADTTEHHVRVYGIK